MNIVFATRIVLAAVLCAALAATAQAPQVRIGVVFYTVPLDETVGPTPKSPFARALVEGLLQRGWVDGRNARIVWRSGEGHPERIPLLVDELLKMPIDILVASGNDIALEAVKRSPATPVVLGSSDYPVENGLAASLSRPGGSITGLTNWSGSSLNAGKPRMPSA